MVPSGIRPRFAELKTNAAFAERTVTWPGSAALARPPVFTSMPCLVATLAYLNREPRYSSSRGGLAMHGDVGEAWGDGGEGDGA